MVFNHTAFTVNKCHYGVSHAIHYFIIKLQTSLDFNSTITGISSAHLWPSAPTTLMALRTAQASAEPTETHRTWCSATFNLADV